MFQPIAGITASVHLLCMTYKVVLQGEFLNPLKMPLLEAFRAIKNIS
jgi:hypothetical protein